MKFLYFCLISLFGFLQAETGAFVEFGAQREKKEVLLNDKSTNFSFGYIYDFNTLIGMGLQAGYSKLPKKIIDFSDYSVELQQKTIDFFWNPVVLNLNKFRVFSKFGQSRYYSSYFVDGNPKVGSYNLLTVRGIGIEVPLYSGVCFTANYLQQVKKKLKLLSYNGVQLRAPYLNRFELALRYNFPYQ